MLELDYGTPQARSVSGITLRAVELAEGQSNEFLSCDLRFEYPLSRDGILVARTMVWGGVSAEYDNFLVEYAKEDRTTFKEVFRAAPIRISDGPSLKIVRVTAIRKSVAGVTDLKKRQAAEAVVKSWAWDRVGNQAELKIDGASLGTCHLRSARPSDLSLPDAVTFELEFVTGYGA
jgi:hypothetical protein